MGTRLSRASGGAAGFVSQQRYNRRATVVVLIGTFLLVAAALNAIVLVLGGYSQASDRCSPYVDSSGTPWNRCEVDYVLRPGVLLFTALVTAGYLVIAWLCSSRAALALNHALPADDERYAPTRALVEQMSIAAGIPVPRLYVIDDPAPNAFATGRSPSRAAITVTTGLLATMSIRELRGVLAHEMAHIKNRDIAVTTLAVLAVGLIALLAQVAIRIGLVAGRGRNSAPVGLALLAVGLVLYILAVPAGLVLKAALSRRREALADATAVEFTREPAGLRSALEKLEADTTVVQRPSPAAAHLWIESPLERGKGSGLVGSLGRLFDTHPPLSTRIELLRGYEGLDPTRRGPNDPPPQYQLDGAAAAGGVVGGPGVPLAGMGLMGAASPEAVPPGPAVSPPAASWQRDPLGHGELRWWDGQAWAPWAASKGTVFASPLAPSLPSADFPRADGGPIAPVPAPGITASGGVAPAAERSAAKKSGGKIALIVVGVLLAGGLALGGCGAWVFFSQAKPYVDAANTYLAHLRSGDLDQAKTMKCSSSDPSPAEDLHWLDALDWGRRYDLKSFTSGPTPWGRNETKVEGSVASGRGIAVYPGTGAGCIHAVLPSSD